MEDHPLVRWTITRDYLDRVLNANESTKIVNYSLPWTPTGSQAPWPICVSPLWQGPSPLILPIRPPLSLEYLPKHKEAKNNGYSDNIHDSSWGVLRLSSQPYSSRGEWRMYAEQLDNHIPGALQLRKVWRMRLWRHHG